MKALALVLLIYGAVISGCIGQAETQTYFDIGNSSKLVLFPDGKYTMVEKKDNTNGDWKIENKTLYLMPWYTTYRFSILNNSAVMGEKGDIWIRT